MTLTQAQLAISPPTHGIMDVPDEVRPNRFSYQIS